MKVFTLFFSFILLGYTLVAQHDGEVFATIFKSQKKYIKDSIPEKQQSRYFSLLHFSNVLHHKINKEIQRIDSTFLNSIQTLNILEFFSNYNNVSGIIWKGDVYYLFEYGSDKKLLVSQRSYAQLNDTLKVILTNFNNWNHSTFAANGLLLGSPTDHPFFLASKFSGEAVETIGFYYQ